MNNDITDITGPVGGTEVGVILSNRGGPPQLDS